MPEVESVAHPQRAGRESQMHELGAVVTPADREHPADHRAFRVGGRGRQQHAQQLHQLRYPSAGDGRPEEHRVCPTGCRQCAESPEQLGHGVRGSLADRGGEHLVVDLSQ